MSFSNLDENKKQGFNPISGEYKILRIIKAEVCKTNNGKVYISYLLLLDKISRSLKWRGWISSPDSQRITLDTIYKALGYRGETLHTVGNVDLYDLNDATAVVVDKKFVGREGREIQFSEISKIRTSEGSKDAVSQNEIGSVLASVGMDNVYKNKIEEIEEPEFVEDEVEETVEEKPKRTLVAKGPKPSPTPKKRTKAKTREEVLDEVEVPEPEDVEVAEPEEIEEFDPTKDFPF